MGNIKNSMDIIWIKLLYFNSWKFYLFDYVVVSKRNRISLYDCVSLFVYEVLNALIIRVSSRMVNIGQFIRELRKSMEIEQQGKIERGLIASTYP